MESNDFSFREYSEENGTANSDRNGATGDKCLTR